MGRRELGQLIGLISTVLLKIDDQQFQNLLNGEAELVYQEKAEILAQQEEVKTKEVKQEKKTDKKENKKIGKKKTEKKEKKLKMKKEAEEEAKVKLDPVSQLIEQLLLSTSREEAKELITSMDFKKDDLTKLAKRLNVHLARIDRKKEIVDKIVEVVVGAKLRSKAIQDIDLN